MRALSLSASSSVRFAVCKIASASARACATTLLASSPSHDSGREPSSFARTCGGSHCRSHTPASVSPPHLKPLPPTA
eukprot:3203589-Rhodomonas_salina.1